MDTLKEQKEGLREETSPSPVQEIVTGLLKLADLRYDKQSNAVKVENIYPDAIHTGMTLEQKVDYFNTLRTMKVDTCVIRDNVTRVLLNVPTIGKATGKELLDCLITLYVLDLDKYVKSVVFTPLTSLMAEEKSECLQYLRKMSASLSIVAKFEKLEVTEPETEQAKSPMGFYLAVLALILFWGTLFMTLGRAHGLLTVNTLFTIFAAVFTIFIAKCASNSMSSCKQKSCYSY